MDDEDPAAAPAGAAPGRGERDAGAPPPRAQRDAGYFDDELRWGGGALGGGLGWRRWRAQWGWRGSHAHAGSSIRALPRQSRGDPLGAKTHAAHRLAL
jgi:hypothetical protein